MIKPLHDFVVIEPIDVKTTTESGLYVGSKNEKDKPKQGKVVAVGPGKALDNGLVRPMSIHQDDVVLYHPELGTAYSEGGINYIVIEQSKVFAVIK